MNPPIPASLTKHLSILHHPLPQDASILLPIRQVSSTSSSNGEGTGTTGTTLWSSAQVLSAYLAATLPSGMGKKVIELGSGTGHRASLIFCPVAQCDGLQKSTLAAWITGRDQAMEVGTKRWDIIVMTDTLYASHLIDPLWKTLIRLSSNTIRPPSLSLEQDKSERGAASPIYFALESRDPAMIAQALDRGRALGFELKKAWRFGKGAIKRKVEGAKYVWMIYAATDPLDEHATLRRSTYPRRLSWHVKTAFAVVSLPLFKAGRDISDILARDA
ncbi:hypothetical protein L204_101829 [Cryptococcus depauperatus]